MRSLIVILLVSLYATHVNAQTDTSRNVFNQKKTPAVKSPAIESAKPLEPINRYRLEDRIIIRHDELPNSLRETLMNNTYNGWENATIYKDRLTGEFYYEVKNDKNRSSTFYRFDTNGKPITETNGGNK
jgi:hypothetical protein